MPSHLSLEWSIQLNWHEGKSWKPIEAKFDQVYYESNLA